MNTNNPPHKRSRFLQSVCLYVGRPMITTKKKKKKILQVISTLKLVRFPTKCSPEIKGFMKYTTHKICILADNEIPVKSITQRNCIK